MKYLIGFIYLSLALQNIAFADSTAKVFIDLSPAGSFEINGDVKGTAKKQKNTLKAKKLKFVTKSLKTGLDLRDKHTKEKIKKNIFVKNAVGKDGKGKASIKINGVQKSIKFNYDVKDNQAIATFHLNLKDFKFKGINYMGVGVKDKVKIQAYIDIK